LMPMGSRRRDPSHPTAGRPARIGPVGGNVAGCRMRRPRSRRVHATIVHPNVGRAQHRCSGVDRPHRRPRRRGGGRALAPASRRGTRGSPGSAASVPSSAGQDGRNQSNPWPCSQVPPGHRTRDARVRNSRTNALADPMILREGWAVRSLTSRSEVRIVPGSRLDHGDEGPPRRRPRRLRIRKVAPEETSRGADCAGSARCPARRPQPRAATAAQPGARSHGRRAKPICRPKSLVSRGLRRTERSQSRGTKPA
jgi:hypothetical protein